MKLYTEEQVRSAMYLSDKGDYDTYSQILNQFTPIELPSDEEINETAWIKTTGEMRQYGYDIRKSFFIGAKWMKEQILNQNK